MEGCVGDFKEECYEDSHPERRRFQPPKLGSRVLQIRLRFARLLWNSLHKTCNEIKDFG